VLHSQLLINASFEFLFGSVAVPLIVRVFPRASLVAVC
jgi:hypothetical protein